jgi:hypothetical protein
MKQELPKRKRGRPATGKDPQHQFRCPDDEWEFFEQAAERAGATIGIWIRGVAMRAAKRILKRGE